jgi:hypothetical protein
MEVVLLLVKVDNIIKCSNYCCRLQVPGFRFQVAGSVLTPFKLD